MKTFTFIGLFWALSSVAFSNEYFIDVKFLRSNNGMKIFSLTQFPKIMLINAGIVVEKTDAPEAALFDLSKAKHIKFLEPSLQEQCSFQGLGGFVQVSRTSSSSAISFNFKGTEEECKNFASDLKGQHIRLLLSGVPTKNVRGVTESQVELNFIELAQ